jgi:hypothetical protein
MVPLDGLDGRRAAGMMTVVLSLRRLVGLLVILVVAALTPLAYADPPDPTWVDGFWDDDDYDSVVVMILGASGIVNQALPDAGSAVDAVGHDAATPATRLPNTALADTASPRAPPALPRHAASRG